jgi:Transmembrane protein
MGLESTLVPTRFLATMGHLIAVVMVFYTRGNNVRAALASTYSSSEFSDAESS